MIYITHSLTQCKSIISNFRILCCAHPFSNHITEWSCALLYLCRRFLSLRFAPSFQVPSQSTVNPVSCGLSINSSELSASYWCRSWSSMKFFFLFPINSVLASAFRASIATYSCHWASSRSSYLSFTPSVATVFRKCLCNLLWARFCGHGPTSKVFQRLDSHARHP